MIIIIIEKLFLLFVIYIYLQNDVYTIEQVLLEGLQIK